MKPKQVKPKDLLKALIKLGFSVKRQSGSHVFLEKITPDKTINTSIALHNEPMPKGTLHGIIKQTQVDAEELNKLL
jgi:predicted RNA binding protein YcfA (HicA-like mRNA interferase family)